MPPSHEQNARNLSAIVTSPCPHYDNLTHIHMRESLVEPHPLNLARKSRTVGSLRLIARPLVRPEQDARKAQRAVSLDSRIWVQSAFACAKTSSQNFSASW